MASSFPDFPMAFWGNTTLNGNPMPAGTTIKAYCDSESLIGEIVITEDGIYGYDLATKNKLLVLNCEGKIIFKYLLQGTSTNLMGDTEINYTDGFESGKTIEKDLSFTLSVSPPSSSGGGGGGGGGYTPPPTPVVKGTTTTDSDIDGNGKIDVFDFNLLIVNWGNNPTNKNADLDNNGKVDVFDFNLLMVNWIN